MASMPEPLPDKTVPQSAVTGHQILKKNQIMVLNIVYDQTLKFYEEI